MGKTIYVRHIEYLWPTIRTEGEKRGWSFVRLEPDSQPTVDDFILITDVSAYRSIKRYKQLMGFAKQNIPMVLALEEPPAVLPYNYVKRLHKPFKRIFTWRTDLVDGKRYLKNHSPRQPHCVLTVPVKKEKLLVLMQTNKRPAIPFFPGELQTERVKAMRYFDKKIPEQFDIFGKGWDKPYFLREKLIGAPKLQTARGFVENKVNTMSKYRFVICYENSIQPGYISDKIWDVFEARCIPIYLGAPDITEYIPANTFIDKRKFRSYDELLAFIQQMSDEDYKGYISRIEKLLKSDVAAKWHWDTYAKHFIDSIENTEWNK
jgi:alpha(1,3/1,4) fucosyltransferase